MQPEGMGGGTRTCVHTERHANKIITNNGNTIYSSSDHDFIEQQETRLLAMCQRTMALPVGR